MEDTLVGVAVHVHERPEYWSARIQDQTKAVYDAVSHWDAAEYRKALHDLACLALDALECLGRTGMAAGQPQRAVSCYRCGRPFVPNSESSTCPDCLRKEKK